MEKKKIQCPKCHGILEVTNPRSEPVLLITCPNPQCGAKMRITFDTGETVLAQQQEGNSTSIGHLEFAGSCYPLAEGENTVGRQAQTSEATIQLPTEDRSMSRMHLRIQVQRLKSGRIKAVVTDLRDATKIEQLPTTIDDEPLLPEDAFVLANGDVIALGGSRIKYVK